MPLVRVKPAEGATIRQPNRNYRIMPADGDIVSLDDTFYNRLIITGDLELVEENVKAPEPEPQSGKKK
jgi:hypothetical protein